MNDGVEDGYKGKFLRLTKDIKGKDRVGWNERPFQGTFDGAGHTLTVSYYSYDADYMAPFSFVRDATIKRLRVAGSIKTDGCNAWYIGGIIGRSLGNTSIVSCQCSIYLELVNDENLDADYKWVWSGGMVGFVLDGSLTVVNTVFDGKMKLRDVWIVGGFLGHANSNCRVDFVNCLFAPSSFSKDSDSDDCSTFYAHDNPTKDKHICSNYTKKNCFRTKKCGSGEGEDASDWSNNQLLARLGSEWHEVDGKVLPDMSIDSYMFATGDGSETSPYQIASAEDWKGLALNISIGANYSGKYFQLINDIELKETFTNGIPTTMLGISEGICFRGNFDGGGHTITLDYTDNNNGDGFVTIADVTALVNKILGKENTLQSVATNIDGLEYGGTSQETVLAR